MASLPPDYLDLARWYDAIYTATGKDYDAEAAGVRTYVDAHLPAARSLLDVACGTGQHLARWTPSFEEVVGCDVAAPMLRVARERLGAEVGLVEADFGGLDLGRRFDVVTCLFSAIGHVADAEELDRALARMAAHVAPGGLLLVEPWITPDVIVPGGLREVHTARIGDDVAARVVRSVAHPDALEVEFVWTVATPDATTTARWSERMPVFTRQQLLDALAAAGLEPSWEVEGLWPGARRGMLVGRAPSAHTTAP
ncbi:MAG: class I SAM-dependent methyltransferase [Nitriliruptoraceae bacterium]|nr:class I SAM-dependent methyltransferase [Nitriliruptoraceae bacterium]